MRSPVAGIAPEDELPAALEPLDEERATPDGSTRPRIVDPVAPDLREIRTAERVRREDVPEEVAPARGPRPKNHSHGLAIDGARTPDGGVEVTELRGSVTAYGPEREDEVLGRDRDSVAPARLRADVVGQSERSPPRVVDPRDEAFLVREVGTDLERLLQNLLAPAPAPLDCSSWAERSDRQARGRACERRACRRASATAQGRPRRGRPRLRRRAAVKQGRATIVSSELPPHRPPPCM